MNRLINKLLVLLALQLAVTAWVFWPKQEPGFENAQLSLIVLAPATIDRLLVSDADSSLIMTREDNGWRMPEYHGLPVDISKVESVLAELPQLSRGYPVAKSAGASERFEVASDNFQLRLEYVADGQNVGRVFLGTSPGFRKVHARINDENAVYAVEFNSYDIPANPAEWLDKSLLQLEEFQSVTGLDFALILENEQWTNQDGLSAEETSASGLINGLKNLQVTAVADIAIAAIFSDMQAPPTLVVESGKQRFEYRLYEIEAVYYIHRDDLAVYFNISKYDYDRLNNESEQQQSEDDSAYEDSAGGTDT
jgi:hypothetical protein